MFSLQSPFPPTDMQQTASQKLVDGVQKNIGNQVLLGVTGSGKTYTIAQTIQSLNMPTLIISHNKTLAGQLYQEMRDFFPKNGVSYYVSYYDYYQPEAYIPQSGTYIEKEAQINDVIDKLRLQTTSNILTRDDVIVVASVSCIYNIGNPQEYGSFVLPLTVGDEYDQKTIFTRLVELQYERSEFDFKRGTFRLRGTNIDVYLAYDDVGVRISHDGTKITGLQMIDPLTGHKADESPIDHIVLYPAKHYLIRKDVFESVEKQIGRDLESEVKALRDQGKIVEGERLLQKVSYDMEMMREMGYVNGIENYSRYFDGRKPGDPPYSLLDYFNYKYGKEWLVIIDESHMTLPQLRGMYNGDQGRKANLIDYGFRLQASLDNRPLRFEEIYARIPRSIYLSATPNPWEIEDSHNHVVELLVRPTGIVDPEIDIRPTEGDIEDLIKEIEKNVMKKERVLVTTLTKRTAEDLTSYLKEKSIRAVYVHSDIKTLERTDILQKLRKHEYDVLIGVNLLREGLDLPEVTLVAILEGDKEGFLRSRTSLIQTMGRAARNIEGKVIIYADKITKSMKEAMDEVGRRRIHQIEYNEKHGITPSNIKKSIREEIVKMEYNDAVNKKRQIDLLYDVDERSLTPFDKKKVIRKLEKEMKICAEQMDFESAIILRDKIATLEK